MREHSAVLALQRTLQLSLELPDHYGFVGRVEKWPGKKRDQLSSCGKRTLDGKGVENGRKPGSLKYARVR